MKGDYKGVLLYNNPTDPGCWWNNPFAVRRTLISRIDFAPVVNVCVTNAASPERAREIEAQCNGRMFRVEYPGGDGWIEASTFAEACRLCGLRCPIPRGWGGLKPRTESEFIE